MINFADSTNPAAIPSQFTHVAAYPNGRYAWPTSQLARFKAHIEIAVLAGQPQQARIARELDCERFDAGVRDFPPFAEERHAEGHDDPTAYSSIVGDPGFGLRALLNAIDAANYTKPWRLHVAWFWGRPFPPTAAEVLAEIRALTDIRLPVGILWACQWQNGAHYDTSVLYGRDDFTRTT